MNFTSLGYGDVVMSTQPGSCSGRSKRVNGVLMLGMTAAALMAIVQHMIKSQRDAILGRAGSTVGRSIARPVISTEQIGACK